MDATSLLVFALALAITSGSPGPSVAALVARVLSSGWRDVMPFLAAMWVGELLWLACALAGLSALAEQFHEVFLVLKYLGVAYLLWLAWRMWMHAGRDTVQAIPSRQSAGAMFGAGMAITLGNPKIMVFYIALLPTLIDIEAVTVQHWFMLTVVAFVTIAATDLAWALLASRARKLLRTEKSLRVTNRLGATTLGGAAVVIASR